MCILGGPPAHNFSTVVPNGIAWKPQAPHATEGLNMDPIKGGKNIFGPTIEAKIPSNWSFYLSHPHKSTKEIISSTYFTPVHHGGHHGGACLKLDRKLCSVCFILVDSGGQWTVGKLMKGGFIQTESGGVLMFSDPVDIVTGFCANNRCCLTSPHFFPVVPIVLGECPTNQLKDKDKHQLKHKHKHEHIASPESRIFLFNTQINK